MTRTATVVLGLSASLLLARVAMTQQAEPRPVASVAQIMQAMVVPSSNSLFDVARHAPESDEQWAAVRNSAVLLAESGNLLLMGRRSKDTDVWRETSLALAGAGAAALRAAEARDAAAVIEAGDAMVDACEVCHETHWDRGAGR